MATANMRRARRGLLGVLVAVAAGVVGPWVGELLSGPSCPTRDRIAGLPIRRPVLGIEWRGGAEWEFEIPPEAFGIHRQRWANRFEIGCRRLLSFRRGLRQRRWVIEVRPEEMDRPFRTLPASLLSQSPERLHFGSGGVVQVHPVFAHTRNPLKIPQPTPFQRVFRVSDAWGTDGWVVAGAEPIGRGGLIDASLSFDPPPATNLPSNTPLIRLRLSATLHNALQREFAPDSFLASKLFVFVTGPQAYVPTRLALLRKGLASSSGWLRTPNRTAAKPFRGRTGVLYLDAAPTAWLLPWQRTVLEARTITTVLRAGLDIPRPQHLRTTKREPAWAERNFHRALLALAFTTVLAGLSLGLRSGNATQTLVSYLASRLWLIAIALACEVRISKLTVVGACLEAGWTALWLNRLSSRGPLLGLPRLASPRLHLIVLIGLIGLAFLPELVVPLATPVILGLGGGTVAFLLAADRLVSSTGRGGHQR